MPVLGRGHAPYAWELIAHRIVFMTGLLGTVRLWSLLSRFARKLWEVVDGEGAQRLTECGRTGMCCTGGKLGGARARLRGA